MSFFWLGAPSRRLVVLGLPSSSSALFLFRLPSDEHPATGRMADEVRGFNVSTRARGGRASAHPLARGKPLPDASLPVTCA